MRAIVYSNYGSPDVLQLQELERPAPKPDQVLIRVRAAEITKGDCELRSFQFPVQWFVLPLRLAWGVRKPKRQILGGYFSGVVEPIGDQTSRFQPGMRSSVALPCTWVPTGNTSPSGSPHPRPQAQQHDV